MRHLGPRALLHSPCWHDYCVAMHTGKTIRRGQHATTGRFIYIYMQYDFDIARLYIREAPLRALYLHPLRKPKAREVFLPSDHAIPFTAWNLR